MRKGLSVAPPHTPNIKFWSFVFIPVWWQDGELLLEQCELHLFTASGDPSPQLHRFAFLLLLCFRW